MDSNGLVIEPETDLDTLVLDIQEGFGVDESSFTSFSVDWDRL